jgi:N-acetylmuramoyl-L-alanine amidase/lysozyme
VRKKKKKAGVLMNGFILGFGRRSLKLGDTGSDVTALQQALGLLGLCEGIHLEAGTFGQPTEAAVKEYQGFSQLLVDGVVGPMTRYIMEADVYGKKPIAAVDLSQHNRLTHDDNDWAQIERNVSFLILRCGVTRTHVEPIGIGFDAEFAFAAEKCRAFGIPFGAYYYGKVATATEGRQEADMCWDTASPHNPLFYVYDVEEAILTDPGINAWAARMRERGAKKLGLYIGHHVYQKHQKTIPAFDFVWIARYGLNNGAFDPKYAPNYPCDLHQFTSKGKLPGFRNADVDLNRLTGTKPLAWFLEK